MKRTENTLEQGQGLVRALEALDTIDRIGPFARLLVWMLLKANRHQLRMLVFLSPDWLAKGIPTRARQFHLPGPRSG